MIRVENVSKRYEDELVLDNVSFSVSEGETFGIIGPNGSGKSTLLKLISRVEKADSGSIELGGQSLSSYSTRQLAQRMAVLVQDGLPAVGFTVREVIEMGRYPFQNWLGFERNDHERLIDRIMERLDISRFASRTIDDLSGGERQRVALGQVMAQEPRWLLLDEPTTYLDIGYQIQMMDYIREWQQESGLTVIAVLHDLNIAAQYCDRLLALSRGMAVRIGPPESVIESGLIEQMYATRPVVLTHPLNRKPQILLQSEHDAMRDAEHDATDDAAASKRVPQTIEKEV